MTTLADINKSLEDQNSVLKTASDNMVSVKDALERLIQQDDKQYDADKADEKERETNARRQRDEDKREARARARRDTNRPTSFTGGLMQGLNPFAGVGSGIAGAAGGFADRVLGGIFGGSVGRIGLGAILGAVGGLIGRGVVFGGLAMLVGRFANDILENVFEDLAPDMAPEDQRSLSRGLSDAATSGLMVSIISRRAGLGVFAGGALGAAMNSFLSDETRQEKFGTMLGREISNEEALNTAMQAAGLATMYGGPMAGLVVAIAGTGVIAMSRLQDFIESKRDEQLQILNDELEARAVEGQQLLETSWLDNLANRLGLNIQDESQRSEQALVAGFLEEAAAIRRQQVAQTQMTYDDYGSMDPTSTGPTMARGEVDRNMLSEERAAEFARMDTILSRFMGDSLQEGGRGSVRRNEILSATDQSIRNMLDLAEVLGRTPEQAFLQSILDQRDAGEGYRPENSSRGILRALGLSGRGVLEQDTGPLSGSGVLRGPAIDETGTALEIAGAVPEAVPTSGLRLEDIQASAITLPTTATIDPSQMQMLMEFIRSAGSGGGGGGGGPNVTLLPVGVPIDRNDSGIQ